MSSTLPPPQVVESRVELQLAGFLSGCQTQFLRACAEGRVALEDVARLAEIDPMELQDSARVDLIQAWERVRAQVDGQQQRALGSVIEATQAAGLDGDAARHEVGAALRLSPVTAYARTRVAAELVRRLPGVLDALVAGDISYLQAKVVAEATDALPDLPPETVAAIEAKVLRVAPDQTVAETRRTVARAVMAADPTSAQDRHDKAAKGRSVERHQLPDAMAGWWVTMPAPAEAAAWAELTRRARATQDQLKAGAGCDPGLDALRVDTLIDALMTAGATPTPTSPSTSTSATPAQKRLPRCRCGGAQTAAVVVDLPTALGLAQNPGELPGYGPIPPAMARAMAGDRDWVRWTTDPGTRRLLDRGARRYRPSGRLRAYVAAAARTCGFPGCGRPSDGCDTDHRTTFRRGGRTIVVNLGPLCRTHHNAKTHGRWRVDYNPDTSTLTWTSPLGRTYTKTTDPPLLQ